MTLNEAVDELEAMNRQIAWSGGEGRYVARPETLQQLMLRRQQAQEAVKALLCL